MNRYFAALAQRSGVFAATPHGVGTRGLDSTAPSAAVGEAGLEVEQTVLVEAAGTAVPGNAAAPASAGIRVSMATPASAGVSAHSAPRPSAAFSVSPPVASSTVLAASAPAVSSPPQSDISRAAVQVQRKAASAPVPQRGAPVGTTTVNTGTQAQPRRQGMQDIASSEIPQSLQPRVLNGIPAGSTAYTADAPARAGGTPPRAAVQTIAAHGALPAADPRTTSATAAQRLDVAGNTTPTTRTIEPWRAVGESARAPLRAAAAPDMHTPIEIHIGAINLEIRQPQAPAPVAAPRPAPQRAQSEPRRLSRFYLR